MAIHRLTGNATSWAALAGQMESFCVSIMGTYTTVFTNGKTGMEFFSVTANHPDEGLCLHHTKSRMNYIWIAGSTADSDRDHISGVPTGANYNWYSESLGGDIWAQDESYMRGYMMQDPDPSAPYVVGAGNNSPQALDRFGTHNLDLSYESDAQGNPLSACPWYKDLGVSYSATVPTPPDPNSPEDRANRIGNYAQMPGCEFIKFGGAGVNFTFFGGDGLGGSSDYFHMVLEIQTGVFSHWWSGQIDSAVDTSIVPGNGNRFGGFMGCSGPWGALQASATSGDSAAFHSPMGGSYNAGAGSQYETAAFLFIPEGVNYINYEGERNPVPRGKDPVTGLELGSDRVIDMDGEGGPATGSLNIVGTSTSGAGRAGVGGLLGKRLGNEQYNVFHQRRLVGLNGNTTPYNLPVLVGEDKDAATFAGENWACRGIALGWSETDYSVGYHWGKEFGLFGNDILTGRTFLAPNLCLVANGVFTGSNTTAQQQVAKGCRNTLLGNYPGVNPVSIEQFEAGDTLTIGTDEYETFPMIRKSVISTDRCFPSSRTDTSFVYGAGQVGTGTSLLKKSVGGGVASGWEGFAYEKP